MGEFIRIESVSQVHDFFGFPKPKHPLISVLPITDEITNYDYGNYSYVFGFYQISLKLGISGSLVYGRNSYDFQEGTVVFIKPNQVVKIENNEEYRNASGWTLLFHPDLLSKSELGRTIGNFTFFNYENNEALHVSDEEMKMLTEIISKIEEEYNQKIDKHSQDLIISNIDLVLKYCKRYYERQFLTRTNLNRDLITRFENIMASYFDSDEPKGMGVLTVGYCATKLNMSSNYFGDLMKNETGISAKDYINNFLIERAKTLIVGSNRTISEIAFEFGFKYPQSFNKLFRSKTGMTPTQYREFKT